MMREVELEITASIGGTGAPTHGSDALILLQRADIELPREEALARWEHHRLGLLGPDRFIELCEVSGLVADLTFAVLNRALRRLPGRSYLDRRFRNRLLVTDAPANAAAPRNQNRPVVHLGNARPGERLRHRPVERIRAQTETGPALDREGLLAWNNVD
jgi:hypothetical protein